MELKKNQHGLLKESLYSGVHKSGLKVYIMPKKGYSKSYAVFATRYGSVDSHFVVPGEEQPTEVPDGIAHFLEHKLFEEQEGNVFDKFSRLGASANAFTSFNMTAYLFSSTSNFYENFETLLDFVQNPYFTDENVQKEQGIIGQEIRMYEDEPNWRVFFNFLDALYYNHPVKKDIAGTIESISKITKEILYKCYNTFYHPSNMVLFVIGDVEPDTVKEKVEKHIKADTPLQEEIKRIYPQEPTNIHKSIVEQTLSVSMPLFQMGFKDTDLGYGGAKLLQKDIVTRIALEMILGKSSALYQSLYNQGLINDSFESDYTAEIDYAFTSFGGESPEPEKVYELIMQEIERLRNKGLNPSDFSRVKKIVYGRFIRQFNSIESVANTFTANIFKGINILDYIEEYKTIEFEDVQERFMEHFKPEQAALSIIRPGK